MEGKLFARIAAGAFVAVALTMTVLTLREERGNSQPETIDIPESHGDPLQGQIRACAAMGEQALSVPDCREAWADKRRRFLGIEVGKPSPAAPAETLRLHQPPTQDK